MTAHDLVLAAALIVAPPGTPESSPSAERWPVVQAALHQTAIGMELLDDREKRYVLARVEDFDCDLNLLRRRHVDLADAPRVADGFRFPERRAVNEFIQFNRAYRKNLEHRQAWESDRADVIRIALLETDRLYRVWDLVRDSRCEFYYVTVRRQAMKQLKEAVGDEAYTAGDLPPYVPEWRFHAVR